MNSAFCVLPFIHLHLDEYNNVKLCCVSSRESLGQYTEDFDFNSNAALNKVREALKAGERVSACNDCYTLDDNGVESQRIRENRDWARTLQLENLQDIQPELIYYDIRNDNLCNLSCRMCSPRSSSQLAKEFKKIGWPVREIENRFGFSEIVDLKTAKKIYVSGGEPTLMPSFRTFLSNAIDSGRSDLDIRMNTNATNFNKEFGSLLKKFDHVEITVSIDGYDTINRYIRWPSNWATIVENIDIITDITEVFSFNVTVSIWNISSLSSLIFFLEEKFNAPTILLNNLVYPKSIEFTTFPDKKIAIADLEKIENFSRSYKNDQYFKSKINYFKKELLESPLDITALQDFFDFNDTLDLSRGVYLSEYIPELDNCRKYLT